jgi:hypothetical protein
MTMRITKSRWPSRPLAGRSASMPPYDHPAILAGRTLFPSTVRAPPDDRCLKSGVNNPKIGGLILKGKWRGFPVYTLTLEERRNCPESCYHWRDCFGNHMHWADRIPEGPDLERRLEREIEALDIDHPTGFAVRLHILGDFYSPAYVQLWRELLAQYSTLHIFGFTARIDKDDDPISSALVALARDQPDRFAMRFSNAPDSLGMPSTTSIDLPRRAPADAIVCPEQVRNKRSKPENCSACALCWQSRRRIAFVQH